MNFQFNTDNHITGREELSQQVQATVEDTLAHFTSRLTRVEVHLGDVNAHKGGDSDIRCSMEARPEGHQPIAVEHHAGSVDEAVDGAAGKLRRSLEHVIGRLKDR